MPKRTGERGPSWWGGSRLLFLMMGLLLVLTLFARENSGQPLRYGEFKKLLGLPGVTFHNLKVGKADIRGDIVTRDRVSGADSSSGNEAEVGVGRLTFHTARNGVEQDPELITKLDSIGTPYQADDDDSAYRGLLSILGSILIMTLMLVGLLFALRWFSGGSGGPFSVGRSKHKLYARKENRITFADVAGIDEPVEELREVVDFLKRPEKYQALGGRIPKGVLLVGPPGTGKTLLAKAVAGEADVPFFSMSGSDFVEMFVGVGAARVRDLFRDAETKAPCIIFIDELDALGKSRGGVAVGGHDEREQTLNALLVEMDGFESNRGVIIMAATNRPETLDAALMRPGRFDRTVVVDRPDIDGREAILKVHARNITLADDVNLRRVAALTPGSVGADLANLVNEAALLAARRNKTSVGMAEFIEAVEREAVGLERKSRIMSPEEKQRVAVHEGGHALVALHTPGADPVHKVSIVPRGFASGYVLQRPDADRYVLTRSALEGKIRVALGGTIAEELIFGDISTGATSDLNQCNSIAKRMVKEFGMSNLGRIYLLDQEAPRFLAGLGDGPREYSEQTAREVDLEIRKIIDAATADVRAMLAARRTGLELLAQNLVQKETIEGEELRSILDVADVERNGEANVRPEVAATPNLPGH
ncbi:MAG: ATP-dependent zinc metalloprotease FtsH [Gemmataceae bacterium]